MGNTIGGNRNLAGQKLIDLLNARSGRGTSNSPDTVTYAGMCIYLNEIDEKFDRWSPETQLESAMRYKDIVNLAEKIGMGEKAREKLLIEAYKSLNGRKKFLEAEGIVNPAAKREKDNGPVIANPSGQKQPPEHPKELMEAAIKLAMNPHSYCALSGMNAEFLLALDTKTLKIVVNADTTFVETTANCWNLPLMARKKAEGDVEKHYNEKMCAYFGLGYITNHIPVTAFLKGKPVLIKAVDNGFNIYEKNSDDLLQSKALKAFCQVASTISLTVNSTNTQAGRGVGSLFEN